MRHEEKKNNGSSSAKGGTLIVVPLRRLLKKFHERLDSGSELCPQTAESIYRITVKDLNADIDLKTKVLCCLLLDKAAEIREFGAEALPILVDAQTIEEFEIGKRATKLLLEGIKQNGTKPIACVVRELEEIRRTASQPPTKSESVSLEMEETLPSLQPEKKTLPPKEEDSATEIRRLMAALSSLEGYSRRKEATERLAELAAGPESEKTIPAMKEELESARATYRSIIPALLADNLDGLTPVELFVLIPKLIANYEKAATKTFHLITSFGRSGNSAFLPLLKEAASDNGDEAAMQREALRSMSAIILRNFDTLGDGSLDTWFEKNIRPIGVKAAIYVLEDAACTRNNGMRESAEAAIKAILIMSVKNNGSRAADARP